MRIKNTVRNSFIFLFPFILLAYILFCINILIKDFSYGHKSHNLIFRYPVSWAFYEIDLFKKKLINNFFKQITPLIEDYVKINDIDLVVSKNNVFIASKKLDITNDIIEIIDEKIK